MAADLPSEAARLDAALDAALDLGPQQLRGAGRRAGASMAATGGGSPVAGEPERDAGDDADDPEGDTDANTDADEEESLEETPRAPPHGGQGGNIRVFVRARPPNSREGSAPSRDIVRVDAGAGVVHLLAEPPRSFAFDGVLGESSTQSEVFDLVGASVGDACLSGYNGSIYVYGQTGSGKTHTMQGPVASLQSMHSDERRGIMCRLLDHIFGEVAKRHQAGGSIQYSCKCSYLEIYKEQITDLLEPGSTNLQVREDINRGIYVERLSEHSVWTVSDAFHVLWKGLHQRHVGATQMNELSSRSHSVFTLRLEASSTTPGGVTSTRVARLNLVDLAGSERQSFDPHNPTNHESLRIKEAGAINRSLSALTNVIMSLSHAGQRRRSSAGGAGSRRPFVRYRDSKLTFLLRDSLGGNSKTVIVACVSPSALCFGETLSTLKFAARAKHIRCAAVMNEEYSGTVESLMLEVKSLKQQLELLSNRGLIPGAVGSASQASLATEPTACGGAGGRASTAPAHGGGDDSMERLLAAGGEDLRRLCGPRRGRRLEILLAGALERERRCELRRHKLDKFTQHLNGLLERKEQYFDALREYFACLVDKAAGEAWYLPELTARLVVFRQQLCSVATDSDSRRQAADMLDGAMEAFMAADVRDLDEGAHERSALSDLRSLETDTPQQLRGGAGEPSVPRSRSYSYGLLMGEAARRSRRSIAQFQQLRNSSHRILQGASFPDGLASPAASAPSLAMAGAPADGGAAREEGGGGLWFCSADVTSAAATSRDGEALAVLRHENRLLRRQLERHPELHRLGAENRLLREHLASLVQQRALAREEPLWPRGHRHQRRAHDGVPEGAAGGARGPPVPRLPKVVPPPAAHAAADTRGEDRAGGLQRSRSLARTSKSSLLPQRAGDASGGAGGRLGSQPFPGIEDATQISASSSSAGSGSEDNAEEPPPPALAARPRSSGGGGAAAAARAAEAAPFLPAMAREVEELFRGKAALEDAVEQLLRRQAAARAVDAAGNALDRQPGGADGARAGAVTEVEPRVASEILRGTTEAMRVAEGLLAKGKGEALLLSSNGQAADAGEHAGPSGQWGAARHQHEGLDERVVFLSLMRSLPSEGPAMGRQSSAPHLSSNRLGFSQAASPAGGAGTGPSALAAASALRPSSSTGSAGPQLLRNRSTMQLHRIAEQPSPGPLQGGAPQRAAAGVAATIAPVAAGGAAALAPGPAAAGAGAAGDLGCAGSADMLREAAQKARQLCQHLEHIGEGFHDMEDQLRPLQEEYLRRLEECKFLEAQCRRLDMHCRLLEERACSLEALSARGDGTIASKLAGGKLSANPWQVSGLCPSTPVVASQGAARGAAAPSTPASARAPAAAAEQACAAAELQPRPQTRRSSSAAALGLAPPPAALGLRQPTLLLGGGSPRSSAQAGTQQQLSPFAATATATPATSSAASLRLAGQDTAAGRTPGGANGLLPQRLSEELLRRVCSAPQLPAPRAFAEKSPPATPQRPTQPQLAALAAAPAATAPASPQRSQRADGLQYLTPSMPGLPQVDGSLRYLAQGMVGAPAKAGAGEQAVSGVANAGNSSLRQRGPGGGSSGSGASLAGRALNTSSSVSSMTGRDALLRDSLSGLGQLLGASFASSSTSSPPLPVQPPRLDLSSISGGPAGHGGPPSALALGGGGGPPALRQSLGKAAGAAVTAAAAAGSATAAPRR